MSFEVKPTQSIQSLIDSAPAALDTLNELAAALNDDPSFASTITNSLAQKASLSGTETLTNKTISGGTVNSNILRRNGIDALTTSGSATITNKTISGYSNNIYGISASNIDGAYLYINGTPRYLGSSFTINEVPTPIPQQYSISLSQTILYAYQGVSATSGPYVYLNPDKNAFNSTDVSTISNLLASGNSLRISSMGSLGEQVITIVPMGTGSYAQSDGYGIQIYAGTITGDTSYLYYPSFTYSNNTGGDIGKILTSNGTSFLWSSNFSNLVLSGQTSLSGTTSIEEVLEKVTITTSAASSTITHNVLDSGAVRYHTTNSSGNWTLNITGDSTTALDSIMSVGQSFSMVLLATNGSTAYYQTSLQVDGSSRTVRWQGGTAPTSGNTNSTDVYSITVIKTGSSQFFVLESQTKFA